MKLILYLFGILFSTAVAVNVPAFVINSNHDDSSMSAYADTIAEQFEVEYMDYIKTGVESMTLRRLTKSLAKSHSEKDMFTKELPELEPRDQFAVCTLCRSIVNVLARMIRDENGELNGENSEQLLKKISLDICLRLNIQTEEVCSGLIEMNYDAISYILRNSEIDSGTFCSLFMEYNFCNNKVSPGYNWTLSVDATGPALTGSKSDTPRHSDSDLIVCHITDIHLDEEYEPGSLAECAEPLCCQREKVTYEGTDKAAGYWGDYRDCDLPMHVFENAMDYIKANHKCDVVIQTGDIISHKVWDTSIEKNIAMLKDINNRLAAAFGDVPVYSCIGNHEPHPLNLFSPSDVSDNINTKWLYEHLYNDWSKWLPTDTKETILKGGYYTVVPKKGYRIIALNSNECYTSNWWLFYSGSTAQPQLQWLHDTLLAAEKAGEYVHILSHIPAGDGTCWSVWAREFNKIVTRFSKTISAIFNGHSHKDEFSVHYSSEGYATAIAWNGGALTHFSYKNPNYKIYNVDPVSYQVTNYHTYMYNLTHANLHPDESPVWFKEYEFIKEFTDDTSPKGMDKLLDNFADDPNLLRKFWRYKVTSCDVQLNTGCDRNCLLGTICRIAVTINSETKRCEELKTRLNLALDLEETTTTTTTTTTAATDTTTTTTVQTDTTTKDPNDGAATLTTLGLSGMLAIIFTITYFQ